MTTRSIEAEILSCDGYQPVYNVDRGTNRAEVLVTRPIGAACQPRQVVMTLLGDTVFDTLPAQIVAGPVGLYIDQSALPATPSATPPASYPSIVNLGPQSSGTTVHASVGQVLFVADVLPGPLSPTSEAAVSSDPTVLGRLGPSPSNEFRAWAPGQV